MFTTAPLSTSKKYTLPSSLPLTTHALWECSVTHDTHSKGCCGLLTCRKLMRGQKALWMGCERWGTENFLFTYILPSGSSLEEEECIEREK